MIRWITAHQEYMEFSRAKSSFRTRNFYIPYLPDPKGPAVGITISKKVAGAVKRNRLKRRVRAWIRANSSALPSGLKMNIIARQGAAELLWPELSAQLGILEKCE
ncbi:MAG: ribonuclease P protein component [Candidatus Cloacimonadaceae bacterium]|jgi:ribonuclease P protein component|nr:ribonuclease P protein component [Candidatus Cloacimonadota bacterium]MDD3533581.1 ribonuclease P protein component [Candidatus Cloacimonadota bacterium]MDY0128237.1 ribonuclease P protein component [Candidatus Cloacimonadaceae bacterium]